MTKQNLINSSRTIAREIVVCDTDYRGNLFLMVAQELRRKDQNATAKLFEVIAEEYGITKD